MSIDVHVCPDRNTHALEGYRSYTDFLASVGLLCSTITSNRSTQIAVRCWLPGGVSWGCVGCRVSLLIKQVNFGVFAPDFYLDVSNLNYS